VRGWEQPGGTTLAAVLDQLVGVDLGAVVVTAIDRDGMLEGPDLTGLRDVLDRSTHPVVASGGVRSIADLHELAALRSGAHRLAGTIVGTALVEGAMSIEEAMAACVLSV
jgi:phosphoribosylformimino-5-aminoimidazole carboxamide ribonucleotide (ProFAR) isomerase